MYVHIVCKPTFTWNQQVTDHITGETSNNIRDTYYNRQVIEQFSSDNHQYSHVTIAYYSVMKGP